MTDTKESEGLVGAIRSGDRLRALEAVRDGVAEKLDATTSACEWASLSRRLVDLIGECDHWRSVSEERQRARARALNVKAEQDAMVEEALATMQAALQFYADASDDGERARAVLVEVFGDKALTR